MNSRIFSIIRRLLIALLLAVLPAGLDTQGIAHAQGYYNVTTTADSINNDSLCSLREAIIAANVGHSYNGCEGGNQIALMGGGAVYNLTLSGAGEDAAATGDLDITATGVTIFVDSLTWDDTTYTIHTDVADRVFDIRSGASATIYGATISGGHGVGQGGGIYNAGTLNLTGYVSHNTVDTGNGGGIYNIGTLNIQDSFIFTNAANSSLGGGGVYNSGGTVTVDNSTIIDNSAANTSTGNSYGGGIYNAGTLNIRNGSLIGVNDQGSIIVPSPNSAAWGAGIYNKAGSSITVNGSIIGGNTATGGGGGIRNDGTLVIENNSTIGGAGLGNSAPFGGGIYNPYGSVTINQSTVSANSATSGSGGGIYNRATLTVQNNSTIGGAGAGNSATGTATTYGGGIYNAAGGTTTLVASTVSANTAEDYGGGIYNQAALTVQNSSVFSGNTAAAGGGVYNDVGGSVTATGSKFLSNAATGNGDAIYNNASSANAISVTGSCLVGNGHVAISNNQPSYSQSATTNWWGHSSGPGPVATGLGDTVSAGVDTGSYHSSSILGCPSVTRSAITATQSFAVPGAVLYDITTLTIRLANPNSIPIDGISFSTELPAGLEALSAASPQCGGTVGITTQLIGLWNGRLEPANGAAGGPDECAINVSVRGIADGMQTSAPFLVQRSGLPDGLSNSASIMIMPPHVFITQTGTTRVTEGGATDTYTIVLGYPPTVNVTISFSTGSQVQPIASKIFTPSNWSMPQTVTVAAVNDALVEGEHYYQIGHTAFGGGYGGIPIDSVPVTITDNDAYDVTIIETGGSTDVIEDGATDTYSLALTAQPTANVVISFATDSQLQAIAPITFTSSNWSTPQTVTVRAVDDHVAQGSRTATITHTAAGGGYTGVSLPVLAVHIADNETTRTPPILKTPKNGAAVYKSPVKLVWKAVKKPLLGYHIEILDKLGNVVQSGDPVKNKLQVVGLPFGVYSWHVAVRDTSGQSAYSAPFAFEVTVLKSPRKNTEIKTHTPKFAWQVVKGAAYVIQVNTDPAFPDTPAQMMINTAPLKNSYPVPKTAPLPSGTYFWRVRVNGVWTLPWQFTIQ